MAATRQFGIISVLGSTAIPIVINSLTRTESVEKAEARDSSGKVTDIKAYSKAINVALRGILNAASNTVGAGTSIVVAGGTMLIDSIEQAESNVGFVELSINASTADSAAITVYA